MTKLKLIVYVAVVIDTISSFIHAIIKLRRSLFERRVSPRMWYYQGFYNWTDAGHGVYIRLDNGKAKLVRTFPNSSYARAYLRHQLDKYSDYAKGDEQLYAEASDYKPVEYKVYTGDRSTKSCC